MVNTLQKLFAPLMMKALSVIFGALVTTLIWFIRLEISKMSDSLAEIQRTVGFVAQENTLLKQRFDLSFNSLDDKFTIKYQQLDDKIKDVRVEMYRYHPNLQIQSR